MLDNPVDYRVFAAAIVVCVGLVSSTMRRLSFDPGQDQGLTPMSQYDTLAQCSFLTDISVCQDFCLEGPPGPPRAPALEGNSEARDAAPNQSVVVGNAGSEGRAA